MSSAGRGQDGKPASAESAQRDSDVQAEPPLEHERDQAMSTPQAATHQAATAQAATPQGTTATVVVSPATTSADETSSADEACSASEASPEPRADALPGKPVGSVRQALHPAGRLFARLARPAWVRHVALVLIYIGAGIAATWPRFTYLAEGKLPRTTDVASFVWGMWWIAHQVVHLGNPFFTGYMAAPVGTQLGFSTMMPLAGFLLTPVTLLWGPSAAFTTLSLIVPGLLCYTMFRAARLWLNLPGSLAAGVFFGLSSMMLWQNWYHVNIAAGLVFLPMTIEAAVRLRRSQKMAPAVWLGIALGAAVLTSQEGAAIALLIAVVILVPWMIGKLVNDRESLRRALLPLGIGAVVALVLASPQLIAMAQQIASGGAKAPMGTLAVNYTQFGVPLQTLFSPSPRLAYYGLGHLGSGYAFNAAIQGGTSVEPAEGLPTFGIVASVLALLGIIIGWRKRATWWFALLWVGCALLALGTSLTIGSACAVNQIQPGKLFGRSCHQFLPLRSHIHWVYLHGAVPSWQPVQVSNLMPYTWLVRIPGLAGLREADRFALVGMIGIALLAGLVVDWLSRRRRWLAIPLVTVVAVLGVLETGWAGGTVGPPFTPTETMPTAMSAFDWPLKADKSKSIVLDIPFGLRGGLSLIGSGISERTFLLATDDGHPRAEAYTAWEPKPTIEGITAHPFYRLLMKYQNTTNNPTNADLRLAAADLKTMHIGWVIEWRSLWRAHHALQRLYKLEAYLRDLGFRRVSKTCLVPTPARRAGHPAPPFCGGREQEIVFLLKYKPAHAFTGTLPSHHHQH